MMNYTNCETQYKVKTWCSFIKNYQKFQDGKSRALNLAWGLPKHKALCDYTCNMSEN